MGRQDTESTDVAEADETAEILELGTILIPLGGTPPSFSIGGVVCRFNRSEDESHTVLKVGLDLKRWRQIPAGSDEERTVADDTAKSDCLACTCPRMARRWQAGVCQSCGRPVGG